MDLDARHDMLRCAEWVSILLQQLDRSRRYFNDFEVIHVQNYDYSVISKHIGVSFTSFKTLMTWLQGIICRLIVHRFIRRMCTDF